MKPLRIKSASGIHLPMKSEYPYRPLKHMEPLRIHSASASTKHGILQNKSGFAKTTTSLWRLFVT